MINQITTCCFLSVVRVTKGYIELHASMIPFDPLIKMCIRDRISTLVRVRWADSDGNAIAQACFFEYDQTYDEIGPAHIFKLNMNLSLIHIYVLIFIRLLRKIDLIKKDYLMKKHVISLMTWHRKILLIQIFQRQMCIRDRFHPVQQTDNNIR